MTQPLMTVGRLFLNSNFSFFFEIFREFTTSCRFKFKRRHCSFLLDRTASAIIQRRHASLPGRHCKYDVRVMLLNEIYAGTGALSSCSSVYCGQRNFRSGIRDGWMGYGIVAIRSKMWRNGKTTTIYDMEPRKGALTL